MSATGSGIVLVGYAHLDGAGVLCVECYHKGLGVWLSMDAVYSPDVSEETPACWSCGRTLGDTTREA
jgi:hypothetical protein